jgi:hypothetical protein
MKSMETLVSEHISAIVAHEVAKGFQESASRTGIQDLFAGKNLTLEQKLSALKEKAAKLGITIAESSSRETRRIKRNAGSGFDSNAVATTEQESDIRLCMESAGCSFREASILIRGIDPGADAKLPESDVKQLAARWKEHCAVLTDSECRKLAEKGLQP